jgi:hypothetical protein
MRGQSLGVLQDGARGSRQDGASVIDVGRCDAGKGQEPSGPSIRILCVIWPDVSPERGRRAERWGQVLSLSKNGIFFK